MTFKETMAKLFSTSEGTYYKWRKEERPIISLLSQYFNQKEIEEFLNTGKINKFEQTNIIYQQINFKCAETLEKLTNLQCVDFSADKVLYSFEMEYRDELKELTKLDIQTFKDAFLSFVLDKKMNIDIFLENKEENKRENERIVTFRILSILDELNEVEFYHFFNNFEH